MSTMLEQAIVDAESLREAALKNAEAAVIEKYSAEVKSAMNQILEQDEEEDAPEGLAQGLNVIPSTFDPETEEEDIVVVDLDQIIAAADAEEGEEAEVAMDVEAVADEVGIDVAGTEDPEAVANRTDEEIEIDEDHLISVFKEMLVVDVDPKRIEAVVEDIEEDEKETDEEIVVSSALDAGMDKEEVEARQKLERQVESLRKQNTKYKKTLNQVKERLETINLSNARLLYANRVLLDTSLNEQQKNKIVEMVGRASSVEEAKMMFETLQKTMASSQKAAPQSLSEAVTRRSSVILGGNRKTEETPDNDPSLNRWAVLAGLNNK